MPDEDYQRMVRDFHMGIGGQKPDAELRINLIQEEANEFIDAIKEENVVEAIDAVCDSLYVIYGTAEVFGVLLNTEAAARTNPNNEVRWAKLRGETHDFAAAVGMAVETIRSSHKFSIRKKLKMDLEDLACGLWKCAAGGLGVDLRPFYREVHRTNMNKLNGPKREDGKQLKPPGWKPPRIKAMYDRLQTGREPHCPLSCVGDIMLEGDNFDIEKKSPHPDGGYVCDRCGGFLVEVEL